MNSLAPSASAAPAWSPRLPGWALSRGRLIDTGTDKRYVRRDENGRFKESVDVGRSLSADKRHEAKHDAKPGEVDIGDHKRK
jgi:hypothetical protein